MADSNRIIVRFAAESTYGTVDSVAGQVLRTTDAPSLITDKETIQSAERITTKIVSDYIETGQITGCQLNFELTYDVDEWLNLFQGMLEGTWQTDTPSTGTDRLTNGTTTTSYSIEFEYDDITQYLCLKGQVPSAMTLNYTPGQIITGSMTFQGAGWVDMAGATSFTGSTAASTTSPMNTTASGLTTVKEGGSASAILLGAQINWTRNLGPRRFLGATGVGSYTRGRLVCEGNITAELADATLWSKYEDHTDSSLQLIATDGSNIIDLSLPNIRYLAGSTISDPGTDGSADMTLNFGSHDNGSGVVTQIDRT